MVPFGVTGFLYSGSWTWEHAVPQQVEVLMLSQLVTVDTAKQSLRGLLSVRQAVVVRTVIVVGEGDKVNLQSSIKVSLNSGLKHSY